MIDLLLIHAGAQHGIYDALGDTLTALEPPTWARMIAGYASGVWAYCAIPVLVRGFYAAGNRMAPARLGMFVLMAVEDRLGRGAVAPLVGPDTVVMSLQNGMNPPRSGITGATLHGMGGR